MSVSNANRERVSESNCPNKKCAYVQRDLVTYVRKRTKIKAKYIYDQDVWPDER